MSKWQKVPLRAIYQRLEVRGRADLPLLSVYRDHGVVPRDERDDNNNRPSEDLSTYKHVRPGDLVVNKMKTWQGSLAVSGHEGIVSPAYFVGQRIADVDNRFMHHLLRSLPLIAEYGARSKGIRPSQWDLPWDEFASIKVALPTRSDQRAIADYLDRETARIDTLIEKKQRMVDLLGEFRQAIVSDKLAKLRESEAVRSVPLGYCSSQVDEPNSGLREQNLLSLSHGNVVRKDIEGRDGLLPESFETYNVVKPGDTVLRLTDLQNDQRSLRVGFVSETGIITSAYITLRPHAEIDSKFFAYSLKSMDIRKDFYALGAGVRQSLKFDELRRVLIHIPSLDTQREITRYLDAVIVSSETTTRAVLRQIALLREHRKALISAAVTGELDLSGAAA